MILNMFIATIEIVWLVSFERLECGLLNVL